MELTLYQIDAFADRVFTGNPAAVCPLDRWLPDQTMQSIAAENNLAETAFFVCVAHGYHIRWFTPVREVKLCGHATLASAYVLFEKLGFDRDVVRFESLSGTLAVRKSGDRFEMDFPAQAPVPCAVPEAIIDAFGATPLECLMAEDYVVVFSDEEGVRSSNPRMEALRRLDRRGFAITARGRHDDFVTRFFAPKYGLDEDPVTGSAFTQLVPYWARVLAKQELKARQVSKRGGEVLCALRGDRVAISGRAVLYLEGRIVI